MSRRLRLSDLKKQRYFYSGKKKRHTLKSQLIVDKENKKIICTNFSNGRGGMILDYLKNQELIFNPAIKSLTDMGYQGIQKIHHNAELPKKKTKRNPLTKEGKRRNRALASECVFNENVIAFLKRFEIIADKYRNRRKRFALRFNLIAGIYNFELL